MVYWLVVAAGMVFWVKNTSFLHQTAWTTGIRRGGGIFVKKVFFIICIGQFTTHATHNAAKI